MSGCAAIEVRGVSRRYGAVQALSGIELAVREGEVLGLIGHNGAGKSTLIRLMLGLIAPDSGEIRIAGVRVGDGERFRALRGRIAYLPENVVFYDNLTGLETLEFFADLKGVPRAHCLALLEQVGLAHAARRAVRGYSKGMRQRLGFVQALLGDPQWLFLDEPTTGLDPEGTREFYDILARLKARGATVILSSHNLAQIEERVDRLALLRAGRLRAVGTVAELRAGAGLPVAITLKLRAAERAAAGALVQALARLEGCSLRTENGLAEVRCGPERKMAVLGLLAAHAAAVSDLDVREPSLEDVFLGYAENGE